MKASKQTLVILNLWSSPKLEDDPLDYHMKSYDGCWTCRLRKKRCDERRPVCSNCATLQILCHFGTEKPPWMDGGSEQKKKAKEVKREVKNASARRRGTLPTEDHPQDQDSVPTELDENAGPARNRLNTQSELTTFPGSRSKPIVESNSSSIPTHTQNITASIPSNAFQDSLTGFESFSRNASPDGKVAGQELDRRFIMFYFDHFFPFLFPFYRPSLLEGGRSWIIELVTCNQAMWHTTLCLSAYFVSIALDGAVSGHNICKTLAWEKLWKQMALMFSVLQHKLQEINSNNSKDLIVETSQVMGSIVQLQRFDISIGNFENCRKHHDAAIALFRQIFQAAGNATGRHEPATLHNVLNYMGKPLWDIRSQVSGAWSSDQAAFRFHSALLLVDDIITSICADESPQLLEYHNQILTNSGRLDQGPDLDLVDFVGCENWVILQIGKIAALDTWKRSMKKDGQLDMMELAMRASAIKQVLLSSLARLDAVVSMPEKNPLGLFSLNNTQLPPMPGGCSVFVTRVWAHAALLYLSVMVSGWQPRSAGIRENVVRISILLEQMPAPELLRTIVLPFCMAGCLSEAGGESRFRVMAAALVPHQLFGAARKALDIMEHVWTNRDMLTVDTTFAACVSGLGSFSLLV